MDKVIIYIDGPMTHHQVCLFGLALDDYALEVLELVTKGVEIDPVRGGYPFSYFSDIKPVPVYHAR